MLRHAQRPRKGFTLVEVLIVVVILGILAATAIPQFSSANHDSQESALRQNLQTLRSQIELYKFQHGGAYPGSGTPTFEEQMLKSTKDDGTVGTIGQYAYGPYLVGSVPVNPYNGKRGLKVVTADLSTITPGSAQVDEGGAEAGWIYNKSTGQIKANTSGNSSGGIALDQF